MRASARPPGTALLILFVAAAILSRTAAWAGEPLSPARTCLDAAGSLGFDRHAPELDRPLPVIPDTEGWTLDTFGNRFFDRSQLSLALTCFEAAVAAQSRAGDRFGEAVARKDRGITHRYLSHQDAALTDLTRAVEMLREVDGEGRTLRSALENLGMSYVALGAFSRGFALYDEVLERARRVDDRTGIYAGLMRMADASLQLDQLERARDLSLQALPLAPWVRLPIPERWPRVGLALAYSRLGEHTEALEHARRALELSRSVHDPVLEAADLILIAVTIAPLDPARAVEMQRDVLGRLEGREVAGRWGLHTRLARALRQTGALDGAIENSRTAVALLEAANPTAAPSPYLATYAEKHQSLYVELADTLVERSGAGRAGPSTGRDVDEAFQTIERGRALARPASPSHVPPTAALDLARLRDDLGARRALVEFVQTRHDVLAFVATSESLEVHRLAITRAMLADRVSNLVDLVRAGDDTSWLPLARRLSVDLAAPWLNTLPGSVGEIVICPDGVLNLLPFEILPSDSPDGGRWLERFVVSYAPSAAAYLQARRRGARVRREDPASVIFVLAESASAGPPHDRAGGVRALLEDEGLGTSPIGLAPLAGARREVDSLLKYGGPRGGILSADRATEASLKAGVLRGIEVLHFATHGLVSERNPWSSALVLPARVGEDSDGLLQAREIAEIPLDPELVVLSACDTARGRILSGEGAQSLARAFLDAGAESVVASLWNADDQRTAPLMQSFYAALARGEPPASALRSAKLAAARSGEVPSSCWASFVVLGAGDRAIPLVSARQRASWLWLAFVAGTAAIVAAAWMRVRRARPRLMPVS